MQTDSAEDRRRAPSPILAALGRVLEAALNRALTLDPETRSRLAGLDGRALTLVLRDTGLALRLAVAGARLSVGPAFAGPSDLAVTATPGSLLALALSRGGDGPLPPGKVEIAGDAELARRLERIASGFAPDFDEAFARVFGDVAGYQLARGFRRAFAQARESMQAFARDGADYLVEESRDLVARAEIESFLDEVDRLRERVDRLDVRVRRLATRARGSSA